MSGRWTAGKPDRRGADANRRGPDVALAEVTVGLDPAVLDLDVGAQLVRLPEAIGATELLEIHELVRRRVVVVGDPELERDLRRAADRLRGDPRDRGDGRFEALRGQGDTSCGMDVTEPTGALDGDLIIVDDNRRGHVRRASGRAALGPATSRASAMAAEQPVHGGLDMDLGRIEHRATGARRLGQDQRQLRPAEDDGVDAVTVAHRGDDGRQGVTALVTDDASDELPEVDLVDQRSLLRASAR